MQVVHVSTKSVFCCEEQAQHRLLLWALLCITALLRYAGTDRTDGRHPEAACASDWRVLGSSKQAGNVKAVSYLSSVGSPSSEMILYCVQSDV